MLNTLDIENKKKWKNTNIVKNCVFEKKHTSSAMISFFLIQKKIRFSLHFEVFNYFMLVFSFFFLNKKTNSFSA